MPTPAVERQADPAADARAHEAITRQPDGAAPSGSPVSLSLSTVLGLQAAAGNAAVAALLGGAATPIEARPPPPLPDLGALNPAEGLARAAGLPPAQLLASLGSVGAAISRSAEHEHAALTSSPPRWEPHSDVPLVEARPTVGSTTPSSDRQLIGAAPAPPSGDSDLASLGNHHVAFHHSLIEHADGEARHLAEPAGEHAIVAGAGPGTLVAAIPDRAPPPASAEIPALDDEGVSQVAADERGAEIRAGISGGLTAMTSLKAAHAQSQAGLRARAQEQMAVLETENRSQRDAERGGAIEQVGAMREAWRGEGRDVLAEASAAGRAASATAQADITRHSTEAEAAASAARVSGRQKAQEAERKGQDQAAREQRKAQSGGPGGILGAIGSAAQSAVQGVAHAVGSLIDRVRTTVAAVLQYAERLAAQAIEKGRRLIRATINTAAHTFEVAAARGHSLLAAARTRFWSAIVQRVARARTAVNGLMARLRLALKQTLDGSARALGATVHVLQAGWHGALDGVRSVVQGALQFARGAIDALGVFAPIVRDVAANPGQWVANLAAGAKDGIRNHLWPDLQQAVREWFDGKVEAVLGLGGAIWAVLQRGGIAVAQIGHVLWESIKAMIPPTLISILIEKIVSLLVPAAAAALLIVQAIQAAWASLSRILQAFDAFVRFLKGVRWGDAGPLFGKAIAAGALAVIDFVSNFLLQRLQGPISKVAGRLKGMAQQRGHKLVRNWRTFKETTRLSTTARRQAPRIRGELEMAATGSGGALVGLGHEFKSFASLHSKIARRVARSSTPEEAAAEIKDALRYTVAFDSEAYSASVKTLFDTLKQRGFRAFEYDNRWTEGQTYVGINAGFISPSGHRFELQLHTSGEQGSWYAKQFLTHSDYERLRSTTDPAVQKALRERMIEANRHVRIPPGAREIPSPVED